MITIYHGGYQAVEIPQIIEGRFAKDFGNGFYCTEIKEQAARWSKRYSTPVISMYEYLNFCTTQALQCLNFKGSEEVKNERTGR